MSADRVPLARRRDADRRATKAVHLTAREVEILALVLQGRANKDIAAALGLGEQSVKGHVSALLKEFAVPNRAALAEAGGRLALTGGIALDPEWIPQLFRNAKPQIGVTRGPEFRLEAVNEAFVEAVGNRPLLGRTVRDAFPELEGQGIIEISERVYATGEPVILHERSTKWDRGQGVEPRMVDLVIQPLRDETGAVNGLISFAVDVTDMVVQRRHAALMIDSFAAVLDLVPRGVIVLDEEGVFVTMNAAARRIAGLPETNEPIAFAAEPFANWETGNQPVDPIRSAGNQPVDPIRSALQGAITLDATCDFITGPPTAPIRVRASVRPLRGSDGDARGATVEFAELVQ
jgi:DNA-binding CsgD family transcriptional regulator